MNWSTYFPPSEPQPQNDLQQERSPWKIDIAKVDIRTDRLSYEENYAQAPFRTDVEHLVFGVQDVRMDGENIKVDHFDTNISNFSLTHTASKKQWLNVKTFALDGQLQKREKIDLEIQQASMNALDIYALMDKSGVINFSRLLPKQEAKKEIVARG